MRAPQWQSLQREQNKKEKQIEKHDFSKDIGGDHKRRGGGSKCDVTPFHLITLEHGKPRHQERFVTDPLLD